MAKAPIRAMRHLYSGLHRQRRSVLILARWLRLFEIPCQSRHRAVSHLIRFNSPAFSIKDSELELFQDSQLPLIDLEQLSPVISSCVVCGLPYCPVPDLREGCSTRCRFQVATRRFGSSHWFLPGASGKGSGRRVLLSELPPWQQLFVQPMLESHKASISEGRLILALALGRPLFSHERVRFHDRSNVSFATTELALDTKTPIIWPVPDFP